MIYCKYIFLLFGLALCHITNVNCNKVSTCKARDYGFGTPVCVCDSKYCDTVPTVEPLNESEVAVFISDKSGRRFERTVVEKKKTAKRDADITISVDPSKKYQTIDGFGGCITDSCAINVASLPKKVQDQFSKAFFSKDGIEYSILRVVIAGCDGSVRAYSYDDVANDFNLTHFALVDEDLKYKIPLLQSAMKYGGDKLALFGSSWSAPSWMKSNGRMNGNGTLKGQPKPDDPYYTTWANYYIKFLEEYSKHGITFWSITAQNEPTVVFAEGVGWQTQRFTAEMQRDFIKYNLGPALEKSPFKNVSIMIVDDNRQNLPVWPQTILSDSEVSKYVSRIGVHYYADRGVPPNVLDTVHKQFPNVPILATEASLMGKPMLGDWEQAELYTHDIIEDLKHWLTGWVEWALAMDLDGGPSWADNHVTPTVVVNATAGEFYKVPSYYAMGHFSKFLQRGSQRIDLISTPETILFEAVAFLNTDGYKTVVLMNKKASDVTVSIGEVNKKETAKITLPARSLATILWK